MRATPRPKQKQGAVSFDKLEPSKENIQPLLRSAGKRMHSLAQNLQQTPKALTEKQERERRQWECALQRDHSNHSNDPLSLWLKYIKWTKLNFTCPTNQKAQLLPLIERCTRKFKQDQRYSNNKHYIKLWLEYAHLSRDSMEVFKFLHANKIGANLALFWRGWAIVAEQNNQFDLVDRIFTAAKNIQAQPIKDINKSYDAFLARMKKKISSQNIDVMTQLHSRPTLGQMNESQPIGSYRKNHRKPVGFGDEITPKNHHQNNNENNTFGVYCARGGDDDDANEENNLPSVCSGWRNLGSEYNRSKENDGIPTAWNNQGFGENNHINTQQTQAESTFAIPMDDELRCTNSKVKHNEVRGHSLIQRKANFSVQDKLCSNPLANYENPKDANDVNMAICTHMSRAMGAWSQQGRYLCASFVDPQLLTYNNTICSLEEARCRRMKPIWNLQMEQDEKDSSDNMELESESDDMMMTVSVGKILYNKNNNMDLSIPSTIKEEPLSTKSNILTDNNILEHCKQHLKHKNNVNRKRKNSDEKLESLTQEQPLKKRFKFTQNVQHGQHNALQVNEEHTYDVFAELTTTNFTNTIQSHYETPLRRLDFATPSIHQMNINQNHNNNNNNEEISSMTEFFKNPIKISDKRMCDTPTVNGMQMNKPRLMNPTATVTFHSKAAMNDIVKIFGAQNEDEDVIMNNNNNNDEDGFGIYEDTQTVHTQIDMKQKNNYEDTQTIHTKIDIGSIKLDDNNIPNAENLSIANDIQIMDPFDVDIINKYEAMILMKVLNDNDNDINIIDARDTSAPIVIDNLLNGETDIELDDDNDVYLNVTEYICELSNNEHFIFVVNDLSQEDDTERMLLIDYPLSLRSYYITKILKEKSFYKHISHMFAVVESVYLYHNSSFTLCKMNDNFKTLNDILLKANKTSCDLHEKLLLYYITEIVKIISHLHESNIIHSNLNINSFLVKFSECNCISMDWTNNIDENNVNGWHNFGLLLHDINHCIKIDDCITIEENKNNFGCLINEKNLDNNNNNNMACMFQKLINNKVWCYEVDHFSIFVIILQLLTQTNDENIVSEILNNIKNINENDIIKYINNYRNENGLTTLQNGKMWNEILDMLLMKDNNNNNLYEFNQLSILNRQNYLKQCYKHCAEQLMDLENLSPKLQIILARLDRMIQT